MGKKRINAKKTNEENETFSMRIWFDSIGLRGDLYQQPLHGITAFQTQAQLDIAVKKFITRRLQVS